MLQVRYRNALWLAVTLSLAAPAARGLADAPHVDFASRIQPIFESRCYSCHGPEKQKNGLRLDRKESALAGGDSGPVIVPGKSSESRLIRLVSGLDPDQVMPPKGDRLSNEQIGLLRTWIDQGAIWAEPPAVSDGAERASKLWCLQPLHRPPVPKLHAAAGERNPIDHFILEGLARRGLALSPEADRQTLIRRVTYDLHGLPPTPGEIEAFVQDPSTDAYEHLVDRLLASPRYGERWGRHWLDVVRFTESQGFEYDHMRENAWQYRDYVIASFNNDKPYNQFVREQIAGDTIEPITSAGLIATGFLVCGAWDQAGSSQANVTQRLATREEELEDLISVVSQTFLGLTVNCARCHAHKFDPIPHADYYRLKAVFEGVRHGEAPIVPPEEVRLHTEMIARIKADLAVKVQDLAALAACEPSVDGSADSALGELSSVGLSEGCREDGNWASLTEAIQAFHSITPLPVSYIGVRQQPEPTHRLKRGDVRSPLEVVTPGALSAAVTLSCDLGLPADAPEGERRRRFANWLVDERNPLAPRVLVNRLWHYHFGQGIVATPNDFGMSGAKPSHPELLDWLACELLDRKWSIKALQRLIVSSAAYRQASDYRPEAARLDADNQALWRFTPRRLEAEELRDAMLAVSGELNVESDGPGFRPFDTKSFNATFYYPKDKQGPEFNRRTVYRMNINSGKDPLLEAFDCPDPSVKTPRRGVTITPLQALNLMNSSFVQRQAARLADRVRVEGNDHGAIERAYRLCFGRAPSTQETRRAADAIQESDLPTVCWALLNATEFLYVK